jgi:hypothetical protein
MPLPLSTERNEKLSVLEFLGLLEMKANFSFGDR